MVNALSGVEDAAVLVTTEKVSPSDTSGGIRLGTDDGEGLYRVCGIAVICHGGESPGIRLSIIQMLTAAFDLSSSRIYVGAK